MVNDLMVNGEWRTMNDSPFIVQYNTCQQSGLSGFDMDRVVKQLPVEGHEGVSTHLGAAGKVAGIFCIRLQDIDLVDKWRRGVGLCRLAQNNGLIEIGHEIFRTVIQQYLVDRFCRLPATTPGQ